MASRRDDRKEDEVGDMLSSLQARLAKAGMGAIAADMQGLLRETETRQEVRRDLRGTLAACQTVLGRLC